MGVPRWKEFILAISAATLLCFAILSICFEDHLASQKLSVAQAVCLRPAGVAWVGIPVSCAIMRYGTVVLLGSWSRRFPIGSALALPCRVVATICLPCNDTPDELIPTTKPELKLH